MANPTHPQSLRTACFLTNDNRYCHTFRASITIHFWSALIIAITLIPLCDGSKLSISKEQHDHNDVADFQNTNGSIIVMPLLHSDHVLSRRRLESKKEQQKLQIGSVRKDSSSSLDDTFGEYLPSGRLYNGYGTHYVDLWVGEGKEDRSTSQRQTLIVDTGSRVTAFPCEDCEDCGDGYHVNDPFDNGGSTTFERSHCGKCTIGSCVFSDDGADDWCGIEMKYAEGSSWYAYEATDSVFLDEGPDEGPSINDDEQKDRYLKGYYDDDVGQEDIGYGYSYDTSHTEDLQSQFLDEAQSAEERAKQEQQQTASETKKSSTTKSGEDQPDKSSHNETHNETQTNEVQQKSLQPQTKHNSIPTSSSIPTFRLTFGCQTKVTGLFRTQLADGIMGMENSHTSFWNQMYRAGMIKSRAFALCYADAGERATKEGVPAGTMTLGGADSRMHKSPMRYAHNRKKKGWYEVYVKGVHLRMPENGKEDGGTKKREGGQNGTEPHLIPLDMVQFNSKGVMIDSGTTESYLPGMLEEPLEEAFLNMAGIPFKSHYSESFFNGTDINDILPTIVFQLQAAEPILDDGDGTEWKDADGKAQPGLAGYLDEDAPKDPIFEIEPSRYLSYHAKTMTYRMGFHLTEDMGYTILGANAMFGYNILFDVENNRIGFAKSDCSHEVLRK